MSAPLFTSPPQSLCLLRLSAIGDCCHALALVQAIQRQWPETKITWIIGKVEANLFTDLEGVELIPFDKKAGLRGYLEVWRKLRGRRFDALLHLQSALRASLLTLGIRARWKLGFDSVRSSDGQKFFINYPVPSPSAPHVVDGFMAFANALGITDLTAHWEVPISQSLTSWCHSLIGSRSTLIICPAASKAYKNWTAEGYAAIAKVAIRDYGMQVLICGSNSLAEQQLAKEIAEHCPDPVANLIGETSLPALLALIKEARLVLAPDTGPVHMATLVGTPVIALYAHHNPARVGPYLAKPHQVVSVYQTLIEAERNKPLAELDWRCRVRDPNAMQQISIEAVIAAFREEMDRPLAQPLA